MNAVAFSHPLSDTHDCNIDARAHAHADCAGSGRTPGVTGCPVKHQSDIFRRMIGASEERYFTVLEDLELLSSSTCVRR